MQEEFNEMGLNETGVDSIILTSNDYLGIANHPKILSAQEREIKNQQNKIIMSAVFMTENSLKGVFEKEMAQYFGYESSILCQSGWAANVGLLQAIAEKDIPVYIDFFAHMSLWEGIRTANAIPFLHNNTAHLEKMLNKHGPGIILIDSLYSTVDFITLSLAKAFAGRAGLIVCSEKFAGYFPYISYPAIFSSSLLNHF